MLLIPLFIAICSYPAISQNLMIGTQAERTVAGYQYGGSLLYETSKQWAYGGFYQTAFSKPNESTPQNLFYGIHIQVPLVTSERLSFFATFRGGLVNKQFAAVIPGLETRISISKRLSLAVGMSMRMSYPAISSKLIIKLF